MTTSSRRARRLRSLIGVCGTFLLLAPPAAHPKGRRVPAAAATPKAHGSKGAQKPAPEPDLRQVVAERITRATGLDAHVRELTYELFASTFRGKGIEVGPKGHPYLAVPSMAIEVSVFGGAQRGELRRVAADGVSVDVPTNVLERLLSHGMTPHAGRIGALSLADGKLTLRRARRAIIAFSGVRLTAESISSELPRPDAKLALSGTVELTAARAQIGNIPLTDLVARLTLDDAGIKLERFEATTLTGAKLSVTGRFGLDAKQRPLKVEVSGTLQGVVSKQWPAISNATVALSGHLLERVTVTGDVQLGAQDADLTLPRRGQVSGAPGFALRLGLGKRKLTGSWSSWRLQ